MDSGAGWGEARAGSGAVAAAGGPDLDRDRDRVAVVFDEVQERQLGGAGGVEGLPEPAFARGAFTPGHQNHFVPPDPLVPVGNGLVPGITEPGLGTAGGLEKLGAGRARVGNDVEVLVPPVGWPLPPAGV